MTIGTLGVIFGTVAMGHFIRLTAGASVLYIVALSTGVLYMYINRLCDVSVSLGAVRCAGVCRRRGKCSCRGRVPLFLTLWRRELFVHTTTTWLYRVLPLLRNGSCISLRTVPSKDSSPEVAVAAMSFIHLL